METKRKKKVSTQKKKKSDFKCQKCGTEFLMKKHLKQHLSVHSETKSHLCELCGKSFLQRSNLDSHMLSHSGDKPFNCDICDRSFGYKFVLEEHMRIHTGEKSFQCEICEKQFARQSYLQHHLATHSRDKPFSCDICGKSFARRSYVRKHKVVHFEHRPYKCEKCDKAFLRRTDLKWHWLVHEPKEKNTCKDCGMMFATKSELKKHSLVHLAGKKKSFKCEMCKADMESQEKLMSHTCSSEGKTLKCNICFKIFTDKEEFSSHMVMHVGKKHRKAKNPKLKFEEALQINSLPEKEETVYKCEFCNKEFNHRLRLRLHWKVHRRMKNHTCQVCGKGFYNDIILEKHALKHAKENTYKCKLCEKQYGAKIQLTRHMRLHRENQSFECKFCGEMFISEISLKSHASTHLKKTKPFKCGVCSTQFAYQKNLTRHMLKHLHSEVKEQHKCETCGQCFSTLWCMKKHMETHVKSETEISEDTEFNSPSSENDARTQTISISQDSQMEKHVKSETEISENKEFNSWCSENDVRTREIIISQDSDSYEKTTERNNESDSICDEDGQDYFSDGNEQERNVVSDFGNGKSLENSISSNCIYDGNTLKINSEQGYVGDGNSGGVIIPADSSYSENLIELNTSQASEHVDRNIQGITILPEFCTSENSRGINMPHGLVKNKNVSGTIFTPGSPGNATTAIINFPPVYQNIPGVNNAAPIYQDSNSIVNSSNKNILVEDSKEGLSVNESVNQLRSNDIKIESVQIADGTSFAYNKEVFEKTLNMGANSWMQFSGMFWNPVIVLCHNENLCNNKKRETSSVSRKIVNEDTNSNKDKKRQTFSNIKVPKATCTGCTGNDGNKIKQKHITNNKKRKKRRNFSNMKKPRATCSSTQGNKIKQKRICKKPTTVRDLLVKGGGERSNDSTYNVNILKGTVWESLIKNGEGDSLDILNEKGAKKLKGPYKKRPHKYEKEKADSDKKCVEGRLNIESQSGISTTIGSNENLSGTYLSIDKHREKKAVNKGKAWRNTVRYMLSLKRGEVIPEDEPIISYPVIDEYISRSKKNYDVWNKEKGKGKKSSINCEKEGMGKANGKNKLCLTNNNKKVNKVEKTIMSNFHEGDKKVSHKKEMIAVESFLNDDNGEGQTEKECSNSNREDIIGKEKELPESTLDMEVWDVIENPEYDSDISDGIESPVHFEHSSGSMDIRFNSTQNENTTNNSKSDSDIVDFTESLQNCGIDISGCNRSQDYFEQSARDSDVSFNLKQAEDAVKYLESENNVIEKEESLQNCDFISSPCDVRCEEGQSIGTICAQEKIDHKESLPMVGDSISLQCNSIGFTDTLNNIAANVDESYKVSRDGQTNTNGSQDCIFQDVDIGHVTSVSRDIGMNTYSVNTPGEACIVIKNSNFQDKGLHEERVLSPEVTLFNSPETLTVDSSMYEESSADTVPVVRIGTLQEHTMYKGKIHLVDTDLNVGVEDKGIEKALSQENHVHGFLVTGNATVNDNIFHKDITLPLNSDVPNISEGSKIGQNEDHINSSGLAEAKGKKLSKGSKYEDDYFDKLIENTVQKGTKRLPGKGQNKCKTVKELLQVKEAIRKEKELDMDPDLQLDKEFEICIERLDHEYLVDGQIIMEDVSPTFADDILNNSGNMKDVESLRDGEKETGSDLTEMECSVDGSSFNQMFDMDIKQEPIEYVFQEQELTTAGSENILAMTDNIVCGSGMRTRGRTGNKRGADNRGPKQLRKSGCVGDIDEKANQVYELGNASEEAVKQEYAFISDVQQAQASGDSSSTEVETYKRPKQKGCVRGRNKNNKKKGTRGKVKTAMKSKKRQLTSRQNNISRNGNRVGKQNKKGNTARNLSAKKHSKSGPPYICEICGKRFNLKAGLNSHMVTHDAEKCFKCKICGKRYPTPEALNKHVLYHGKDKPHKCEYCEKSFISMSSLKTHLHVHTGIKPFKCDICRQTFTTKHSLEEHTSTHTGQKAYQCEYCEKKFARPSYLSAHFKVIHSGEKPYKCDVCDKGFAHPSYVRKHKVMHFDKRPHKCDVCGKGFSRRTDIKAHWSVHRSAIHRCEICGKLFMKICDLKTHFLVHQVTPTNVFKCNFCPLKFENRKDLKLHSSTHLENEAIDRITLSESIEEGVIKTDKAGNEKRTNDDQKNEIPSGGTVRIKEETTGWSDTDIKVSENNYGNQVGDGNINKQSINENSASHRETESSEVKVLKKRVQIVEPDNKASGSGIAGYSICTLKNRNMFIGELRPCHVCGKEFDDRYRYRVHMKQHRRPKKFTCEICGKSFKQRHSLIAHFTIHTGVKDFQCEVCGDRFADRSRLSIHKKVHHFQDKKNYKCELCDRRFMNRYILTSHILTHSGGKRGCFSCHICRKRYIWPNNLKRHIISHGKI